MSYGALGYTGNGEGLAQKSWAGGEATQSAQTAPAALVQPFGPREEGPPLRVQVQQLLQAFAQQHARQEAQIQELADAVRQLRAVVGV